MRLRFHFALAALLISLFTISTASATPVACATAGSFADLMATNGAGGCIIADKVFSDFSYISTANGGAIPVDADDFGYITVAQEPTAIGFIFGFALSANSGQSNDILLGFTITGPNITSNHLSMVGGTVGAATASIGETFCKGGPIVGCNPADADSLFVIRGQGLPTILTANASFAPVNQLGILKDINVTAGPGGFATISGLVQTVDQDGSDTVPEPATMFLGGASLLGLGMLRRFRAVR